MKRSRTIRRALETLGETLLKENESEEVRNVAKFSLKVPSLSTPSLEMKLVTTSVGLQLDDDAFVPVGKMQKRLHSAIPESPNIFHINLFSKEGKCKTTITNTESLRDYDWLSAGSNDVNEIDDLSQSFSSAFVQKCTA
eukprot:scaffold428_cov168-Ochromonas_danica.AAC.37